MTGYVGRGTSNYPGMLQLSSDHLGPWLVVGCFSLPGGFPKNSSVIHGMGFSRSYH